MLGHYEDRDLYQTMISRALKQEVSPYYDAWEAAGGMPKSIWPTLGAAGLLGIDMPEQYGGAGAGVEVCQQVVEEIARQGFGGLCASYNIHANIVMPYILHIGTEDQRQRWLPPMISGQTVGAIAMTEPSAGSDLAALRTSAKRTEDGWLINGAKVFITNGLHADLVIVCAKTDPKAGAKGVSLFLVDASLPGFSRGKGIKKIGQHSSDTAELFFADLLVPHDALLGEEGKGFSYLMQELPRERLGVAAHAIGATEGALALTLNYVQERKAFGHKIGDFQNTRFKLAEAKAQLDMARVYLDHCLYKYNREAMTPTDAAILKLQLTEMQCKITDECLQLFGGYGYTEEYLISRFYVDARVQTIYAGTSEIMKEVIARSLLGK
ncbi:acyl-CoA dehydrogenase family protein [Amphritea sp. 2_MG-2023]|uniref:acyl-CoA dehydrogenase family protein n=1 Tax=Amphritea TaxID=515417 RepID=UPI001C07AB7D|nr:MULTISPECIES: acyl-CoA dehydrogenase family protein [Amphritea]MBU2964147.1 acyl-CoA dehydrogenase family protein [Amphritea atlantica]MDO6418546.1 acyl-CoA dehydrogenase family protein [Amphritea sp. 2_MG-2023]